MELLESEVAHGQNISHAQFVNGQIEGLGFFAGEMIGIHHSRIFIAFGLEFFPLLFLVRESFVTSQVANGFVTGDMVDINGDPIVILDCENPWRLVVNNDVGLAGWFETVVNGMVLAFRQLKFLVDRSKNVVPKLAILGCFLNKKGDRRGRVPIKLIMAVVGIINEAKQMKY